MRQGGTNAHGTHPGSALVSLPDPDAIRLARYDALAQAARAEPPFIGWPMRPITALTYMKRFLAISMGAA